MIVKPDRPFGPAAIRVKFIKIGSWHDHIAEALIVNFVYGIAQGIISGKSLTLCLAAACEKDHDNNG